MGLESNVEKVVRAVRDLDASKKRKLIAIGGPPASGKSTLAERVQIELNANGTACGLIPMDGFHLENQILRERGLMSRKGAPETFDVSGFVETVTLARHENVVKVPTFDRVKDCVVPASKELNSKQRHVIVEGNYLFLNTNGWAQLADFWDLSVFVSPALPVLRDRLIQRWLDHGLDAEQAELRASSNDLVNAQFILENSDLANVDFVLS